MPALGGMNPRSPFGQLSGQKPKVPQLFFTLTEEEIVQVLVAQGFSEKTAKEEAAKFIKYKERIVGPKQVWSDDDDEGKPKVQPQASTQRFADEIATRKEGPQA